MMRDNYDGYNRLYLLASSLEKRCANQINVGVNW